MSFTRYYLAELCSLHYNILMKKLMGTDLTKAVRFAQEGNATSPSQISSLGNESKSCVHPAVSG